jgi:serine protease AprX
VFLQPEYINIVGKFLSILVLVSLAAGQAFAGLNIVRSSGITLTGADGITLTGADGITLTGADGVLSYRANGITLTGADGITLTGADGATRTGTNGISYTGPNGITLTGADGITLTGADGITLTGADGITLTGADGQRYTLNSVVVRRPNGITLTGADGITLTGADGITLTGADGITLTGADGITLTGADGITLTGADGITLTGADGITLTGADSLTGIDTNGVLVENISPVGITLTGADGITLTGADGITLTGADGITLTGADNAAIASANGLSMGTATGLQSVDPELAKTIDAASDDSNINAVVVYHSAVTEEDLAALRSFGILGGTRFRMLPMVYVTGTKHQLVAISRLARVRSIYGNRTLNFNADPYFKPTGVERVPTDADLRRGGMPISGRGVTVAVLDTGINSQHADLTGRVVQNVKLVDVQSAPATFLSPVPVENVANTDPVSGHGTFVAGVVAGSGANSGGRYNGVAPGARLLGLSAGDANLTSVLAGFDYLLEKGAQYNVKVVNCSFSANSFYDANDPVNVATKMLADRNVAVVVSAGNSGSGNGTLNPYAAAPWVISVGATDQNGVLAPFSSRGNFGGKQPTLVAPGVNVVSLRSLPTLTSAAGLGTADAQRLTVGEMPFYTTASGTSFSAPQVAGAAALMFEANPSLTPAEIKDILARTSTPLPRYFAHESGAGMLNTHAAVIESAYPDRRMGIFRSTLSRNTVTFTTETWQVFGETVYPGIAKSVATSIPANVLQAGITINWGLSANDFGLRVLGSNGAVLGESNYLNLPGLTGRREKVVLRKPGAQTIRSLVSHTTPFGLAQNVYGSVEITRVNYPDYADTNGIEVDTMREIERSVLANVVLPDGKAFHPNWTVSRSEFAATLLRAGLAQQYVARFPMFTDVPDVTTRNFAESVQYGPNGALIFDAPAGGRFQPNSSTTRLVAAVALVRAAGLESAAASTALPLNVADASSIPAQFRGHVAVALQKGFLSLENNRFNPARSLTRLELVRAMNAMLN